MYRNFIASKALRRSTSPLPSTDTRANAIDVAKPWRYVRLLRNATPGDHKKRELFQNTTWWQRNSHVTCESWYSYVHFNELSSTSNFSSTLWETYHNMLSEALKNTSKTHTILYLFTYLSMSDAIVSKPSTTSSWNTQKIQVLKMLMVDRKMDVLNLDVRPELSNVQNPYGHSITLNGVHRDPCNG